MRYPTFTSASDLEVGDVLRMTKPSAYSTSVPNVYVLVTDVRPGSVDLFEFTLNTEYSESFDLKHRTMRTDSDYWSDFATVNPAGLLEDFSRAHAKSLREMQEAKSRYLSSLTSHMKYDAVLAFVGSEAVKDSLADEIRAMFEGGSE